MFEFLLKSFALFRAVSVLSSPLAGPRQSPWRWWRSLPALSSQLRGGWTRRHQVPGSRLLLLTFILLLFLLLLLPFLWPVGKGGTLLSSTTQSRSPRGHLDHVVTFQRHPLAKNLLTIDTCISIYIRRSMWLSVCVIIQLFWTLSDKLLGKECKNIQNF